MFAKVKIIITNQNHTNFIIIVKSWLYNEEGQIDMKSFPLEIIIELIISFLLIIYGALFEYVHLEEIYKDKQRINQKKFEFYPITYNYMQSKGGMLNHYIRN
jgi:hypothetical protein